MLDIGFSELLLIAAVALVVVGPQRLPVLTRTVGALLGRAQRYVSDVKSDIQRQMDLEELRKMKQGVEDLGQNLQTSMDEAQREMDGIASELESGMSSDNSDPFDTGLGRRFGQFIQAPERTWTQEREDERIADKVRSRMRKRYLKKKPRYE
ncbi:TatA Sec-independent protein secretion pathway components [Burkholderiales bacterium]|jgi:sec-independent protein translocase protein TatB